MELNMEPSENNPEIKLDGEGEPIHFNPKKNLSKKTASLVLIFVILIIAGAAYFLFFNEENNDQIAPAGNTEVLDNKEDKEAEVDKNLDSDQDKLPDYLEKILGTAIDNPDTDGDGYGDLAEIKNGFNPLTNEKYTEEERQAAKDKIKTADEGFHNEVFGNAAVNSNGEVKPVVFTCGASTVNDIDGNTYNTVQIGSQCWLKENLKVAKNPKGEAITRYCYNNDPKICDTDGGLYD